jgi:hypothetical protein
MAALLRPAAILLWLLAVPVPPDRGGIPDRWNPWAPLGFDDPYNILTAHKLRRLRADPTQCRALLAQSPLKYVEVPDRDLGKGCAFRDAVQVSASALAYSSRFTATCPIAASLALFERHVLQPAAFSIFAQPVVRIEHLGSYACRNINNRTAGRLSEHATANAIDLSAFVLKDGTRIAVRADWPRPVSEAEMTPKGRFLRAIHKGACRYFKSVLGPDYNSAHHDHFHADMGRYSICR